MKMKYLIIVGLILAILTMGAVSASEDVALDDISANDEGVDIEESPAEDVTDESIGYKHEDDTFEVYIEEDAELGENDDVIEAFIDEEANVKGNFSINVDNGKTSWQINHLIIDEDIEDGCAWSLNDLEIYETGIYLIDFKFIPTSGDEQLLLQNCRLEVYDSTEGSSITFNDDFYIEDESFVVVELPVENENGRIVVYVDGDESFNKTLDAFDKYHPDDDESVWAYAIGFNNLTSNIVAGEPYNFKVKVYLNDELIDFDETDEYVNYGSSDDKEEVDYSLDIPDSVRMDDTSQYIFIAFYNPDITGNVTITIGDKLVYDNVINPYYWDDDIGEYVGSGNYFYLYGLDLPQGEYDVVISYAGDDKYKGFTDDDDSLFYYFIDEDNGEIIYSYFNFDIADDANGTIELFINDTSFKNLTALEAYDGVDLSELPYGEYNYTIYYRDDNKYTLNEPLEGEFEHTYWFFVYCYDGDDEICIGDEVTFEIDTPYGDEGTVVIRYNGKVTNLTVYDTELYYSISDFTLGENIVYFTYASDKYPEKTVNKTIDVEPKLVVKDEIRYHNDEDAISILLPGDAVGNMVICIEEYNETSGVTELVELASVALKDGKANYTLDLPLGYYAIQVSYDGDDYKEYFDDDGMYIEVIPDIDVPGYIYIDASNFITVVLPDDGEDNLTVTINDVDDDETIYNAVANGTVIIPIPKLKLGDYYGVTVAYGDFSRKYNLVVRDIPPEFELEVMFPSELTSDNDEIKVSGLPKAEREGDLVLYIDGEFDDYIGLRHYIYYSDYSYGYHTWEIRYENDPYFKADPKSGTFFVDWIMIPSSFKEDDSIDVMLEGKEGYVDFIVDGKSYETIILDDGYGGIIIKGLDFGPHTYEISYYDTNNVKQLTKSGTFNYTYFMYSNIDDYSAYPWMTEFELIVHAPEDVTENITVNVDGKIYSVKPVDGIATVLLTDLVLGANNVTISYPGDAKYNAKELTQEIYIFDEYTIRENWGEGNQKLISFSLSLPKDATGNLSVYNGYYDIDYGWISETLIKSIALENGTAVVYVDDLKFGQYYLRAIYESDIEDYIVDYNSVQISIVPWVNITHATVGDNATIRIEMPNAQGIINVSMWNNDDWEDEYTIEPVDGIFELNVTLPLGTYSFTLKYVGEDYDNPFVESDEYFEPIVYELEIAPKEMDIPENFSEDGSGEITLEVPEGSTGKVSVYEVNPNIGKTTTLIENATYTSENKTISISGLSVGDHDLFIVYVDDVSGKFTKYATVTVPKSDKGANMTIPENITGDSFDVTLPSDATGGIIVTIDGTNTYIPLVNGTAKVDVSNLTEGSHNITIKYAGDKKYNGFEKTATVNISKEQPAPTPTPAPVTVPAKIVAKDLAAFYNKVSYSVTVYGTDGKVASGVTVVFKIDGKKVGTAKTNAKGIATIILKQVPKTYKITSTALGKSVTKKLTVKQVLTLKKAKVKKSAKKLVLKATLKEGKKAIKGKKIAFKFNGKKIKTVKTNKKGVAKVTVKKSILKKLKVGKKVKYQATYIKDTVKKSVKVKK